MNTYVNLKNHAHCRQSFYSMIFIIVGLSMFLNNCLGLFLSAMADNLANVVFRQSNLPLATEQDSQKTPQKKKKKRHKKKKKEEANIWLNFENASLGRILDYLAEQKNINIYPHEDLSAITVSLTTRQPLTLERAWNVLLTLLEMNGFSIIKVDKLYRIISNKDNQQFPLPIFSSMNGIEPEQLPDNDSVIRYIYFFKNMRPDMAQGILSTMLEGDTAVQINPDLQMCMLKEKSMNIKAAMKIVKELDTGGLREAIKVIQLQEARAEDVQRIFEELLSETQERTMRFVPAGKQQEAAYFSSATKIIAEPIKNQLILLGTEKNLNRISEFITKYIDVPLETAKSRVHIKELRYAKAEALGPIVQNIIQPPPGQAPEKGANVGKYKFFEDALIIAEEAASEEGRGSGNRLIVVCNPDDWRRLEKFIDKLDKPTPQVAVEVMIVDITDNAIKSLGAQLRNKPGKPIGLGLYSAEARNLDASVSTADQTQATSPVSFAQILQELGKTGQMSLVSIGKPPVYDESGAITAGGFWALLQAVFTTNNSNIISQPYLVINNFETATFDFSDTRILDGPLDGDKVNPVARTEPKTAGTNVIITPQINSDGIVDLKIKITNNEFTASSPTDGSTTDRSIDTKVSMAAGEVLVLGGLKKSQQILNTYETPLLAKIPIIGNLFKTKNKNKTENNLYVFMRPSIIKPKFEGTPDEYTQLKMDYAKLQMFRNDFYAKDPDPIQRWFFKPTRQSIKRSIEDARIGRFRPIDNFNFGKWQPKTVEIAHDPYYQASEALETTQKKLKKRRKNKTDAVNT